MPIEQTSIHCAQCGRLSLHARSCPNHVVHALVSLFLCGLWVPVWVLASRRDAWRCQTCGTPFISKLHHERDSSGFFVFLFVLFLIVATVAGSLYLAER